MNPETSENDPGKGLRLGFVGTIEAGLDPAEVWKIVHEDCDDPAIRAVFDHMKSYREGWEALETSRKQWEEKGFPAPWE